MVDLKIICTSQAMRYVGVGAGAVATGATLIGANVMWSSALTISTFFGEKCPKDDLFGYLPISSDVCKALSNSFVNQYLGGMGLSILYALGVLGVCASIWHVRPVVQLNAQEGEPLVPIVKENKV